MDKWIMGCMTDDPFKQGVADYRAGKPFKEFPCFFTCESYERGRHFAAIYSGVIYRGRGVAAEAKLAMRLALNQNSII